MAANIIRLNSPPDLTATMNAILTTTSETTLLRLQLPNGGIAWHVTDTKLILKTLAEQPHVYPLKAYGYLTATELLTRGWTYSIHGAIGQYEETGKVFIKHSDLTQSLISNVPPQQHNLAGKANISGIGKVVKVNINLYKQGDEDDDDEWHLTVHAEHEVFDPEEQTKIQFVIIYQFGSFSPPLSEMNAITIDSFMYVQGLVLCQDAETQRLIVQALRHTVVELLPDP